MIVFSGEALWNQGQSRFMPIRLKISKLKKDFSQTYDHLFI